MFPLWGKQFFGFIYGHGHSPIAIPIILSSAESEKRLRYR